MKFVTDCLGRTRPVKHVYRDGSYSCPFCIGIVEAGRSGCSDPGCFARGGDLPPFPRARAEKILAAEQRRAKKE